jgi:hypothetical protein
MGFTKIKLVDLNGRVVYSREVNFYQRESIDFSNISNGIYILNIENDLTTHNHKLIIN